VYGETASLGLSPIAQAQTAGAAARFAANKKVRVLLSMP
jgi:hypothetical protein